MWVGLLTSRYTGRYIPDPVYQRPVNALLWSTFTAIWFLPSCKYGVKSYTKLIYPLGRLPSQWPFIHTSLFRYTPSNRICTFLFFHLEGMVKVFRYQLIPAGRKPLCQSVRFQIVYKCLLCSSHEECSICAIENRYMRKKRLLCLHLLDGNFQLLQKFMVSPAKDANRKLYANK